MLTFSLKLKKKKSNVCSAYILVVQCTEGVDYFREKLTFSGDKFVASCNGRRRLEERFDRDRFFGGGALLNCKIVKTKRMKTGADVIEEHLIDSEESDIIFITVLNQSINVHFIMWFSDLSDWYLCLIAGSAYRS